MVKEYANKLIENLPNNIKNAETPLTIDLVLDGGIFNGSYLLGALYFLKEMEKNNYIKIERISGCSIGSIAAFTYFIDGLDIMPNFYKIVYGEFKKTYNLQIIKKLKHYLLDVIPNDICSKINHKLFICYNNIKKNKKVVKSVYKNVDEIINTIIKSCFIPYLIDGNLLYENKAIDGLNPFIFTPQCNKKILYLDLYGFDKIGNLLNVKNENTNYHRILSGLLDIHCFFIKQTNTQMCSYVDTWSCCHISFNYFKLLIEKLLIIFVKLFIIINNNISNDMRNSIMIKILAKISQDIFIILLETYCI
jgi:hypothetical protein